MVVTEIDKYLKSKKYSFYKLITKEWGSKDPDVIEIKKLWQAAEDASGTNSKIEKFRALQNKLQPMFDDWKKQDEQNEAWLGKYNATQFSDLTDQHNYEFGKDFLAFSQMPTADKLSNLEIGDAFKEHYDFEQMAELAKQYNYDYRNKEERAEFLKNVGEYIRQKDLDAIWNDKSVAGIAVSLGMPTTKKYARENYDNIDNIGDIAAPMAVDVATNLAMMGPGRFVPNKYVAGTINNTLAPVIKNAGDMAVNNTSLEDAAKTAAGEVLTNLATPMAIQGASTKLSRAKKAGFDEGEIAIRNTAGNVAKTQKLVKKEAQQEINQAADKIVEIETKLRNGAIWPSADGKFYKFNKKGIPQEVSAAEKQYGKVISEKDADFYRYNKSLARGKRFGPGDSDVKDLNEQLHKIPEVRNAMKQIQEAKILSTPGKANVEPIDMAVVADITPKETKWNWATRNAQPAGNIVSPYLTNLQGRTKYAASLLTQIGRFVPGMEDTINLDVKPKINQDDPEVKMYKRNYLLHQANPNLVSEPKKPEKLKDFTINEIFGE